MDVMGQISVDVEATRRHGGVVIVDPSGLPIFIAPAPGPVDAPTEVTGKWGDGWTELGATEG